MYQIILLSIYADYECPKSLQAQGAELHVVFCVERNLGPRAICSSIFIFHASKVKYLHAPFELGKEPAINDVNSSFHFLFHSLL